MIYVTNRSEVLCASKSIPGAVLYLCPNRNLLDLCQSMGLDSLLLNESMLRGSEAELNDWAYRVTIDLVESLKGQDLSETDAFLETNFYIIKAVVLQGMKFVLTLDFLTQKYKPASIRWYRSPDSFFVSVCREYLALFLGNIQTIELPAVARPGGPSNPAVLKKLIFSAMAIISNLQARLTLTRRSGELKKTLLVSGALNHLKDLVLTLKTKRSCEIVFFEDGFNMEKYVFCLRNRIPFFVLPKNNEKYASLLGGKSFLKTERILFRQKDYSALFDKLFEVTLNSGVMRFPVKYDLLRGLYSRLRPAGTLFDEDYSPLRRCLAVLAVHLGIRSYVVSHGIPAPAMAKSLKKDRFCYSSDVFANSEHEKKAYENIYFDPKKIHVLGTPRFDKIVLLKKAQPTGRDLTFEKEKVVLLCLSCFHDSDFDCFISWLVGDDSAGEMNRAYIRDLLIVLEDRNDVLVKIKTHYVNEQRFVEDFVASLGLRTNCCVESHRRDIFALENEADLIVTPESTVIAEAVMFSKPVVVMCYDRFSPVVPYNDGLPVQYVYDQAQLRQAVDKSLDTRTEDVEGCMAGQNLEKYVQYSDGKNTHRVAEYIATQIGL